MLGEFNDFSHNNIAEPNRTFDNSTIWVDDFSRDYFNKLLYDASPGVNSMANYFLEQSSGRYTVYGDATDWTTVPKGYAYYDDSVGGEDTSTNVWLFLQDMADGWYADQIAAGKTPAEIDAYLAQFDVLDRYDYDGDGEFNEPDGYIDHFQALHAGEGEEAGGGAMGAEAIWSHSWYANYADIDKTGPSPDFLLGGLQIGEEQVLDRRLHHPARERRRGGLHARVLARPRRAGPLRLQLPREQHRFLDAHVLRLVAERQSLRHRVETGRPGRVGEVPAWLAELRRGQASGRRR